MSDPTLITVIVQNAVGASIPGSQVTVTVRRGAEQRVEHPTQAAPARIALFTGFIQVDVSASAPQYLDERQVLTFWSADSRWESSSPACLVTTTGSEVTLTIPLGRIRLAPTVMLPDDMSVGPFFQPAGVLANERGYRTINLAGDDVVRTLATPASGDPNDPGWNRFKWNEEKIRLAERGNWLVLEYGDVTGRPDALRHLIGVWAPHSFTGTAPPVVVQVTPNTRTPYYPPDRLPFTGAYPYGCVALPPGLDEKTSTAKLRDSRQAYVELPANRCLGQYKIVHQLYAARRDIFTGPNGPIVITPSPPLIAGGPLRQPFDHPDGMGRLVAEVLRFLFAHKLTLPTSAGSRRLRFTSSGTTLTGNRPISPPLGVPRRTLTTVVCHSAGVVPTLSLARNLNRPPFPKDFPEPLWGGRNPYCDENWTNLWVIDGVASPGGIGIPSPNSPAVRTWVNWLRREGRRMVMVYSPSGLAGAVAPDLVSSVKSKDGADGRISEGSGPRVRWLHMSYAYLRALPTANPPGVVPVFGGLGDNAEQSHNKIYEIGVGYAANR